ncbi:M24 family metallopeptidase [Alkaliphilus crotonatoxidans]
MYSARRAALLEKMRHHHVAHMVVADPSNIFYFTGKWFHPQERLIVLLLSADGGHHFLINSLFPAPEDLGVEKIWYRDGEDAIELLSKLLTGEGQVGIDKSWSAGFLLALMEKRPLCYVNGSPLIDGVRMIKDSSEIILMKEASRLNDRAMEELIAALTAERDEKSMTEMLTNIYHSLGAEGHSFSPIVAYGPNGSDPHHETDDSLLKEGDSIVIDIGCKKNSYCSDMTRTVFYRSVSAKAREVYEIVREANERAIAAVKPGATFAEVDRGARSFIEARGYGQYFTHRTGHSIGIDVHEYGDVSSVNEEKLAPGMIFSIEPGIYLPGEFGVRIEDLVLVTEEGCEVLNHFTKDLIVVK